MVLRSKKLPAFKFSTVQTLLSFGSALLLVTSMIPQDLHHESMITCYKNNILQIVNFFSRQPIQKLKTDKNNIGIYFTYVLLNSVPCLLKIMHIAIDIFRTLIIYWFWFISCIYLLTKRCIVWCEASLPVIVSQWIETPRLPTDGDEKLCMIKVHICRTAWFRE